MIIIHFTNNFQQEITFFCSICYRIREDNDTNMQIVDQSDYMIHFTKGFSAGNSIFQLIFYRIKAENKKFSSKTTNVFQSQWLDNSGKRSRKRRLGYRYLKQKIVKIQIKMKNKKNENMTHCEIKRQKANIKGVYSQKISTDLSSYSHVLQALKTTRVVDFKVFLIQISSKMQSLQVASVKDFLIDGRRSLIWEILLGDQKEQFQYITVHNFGAP